MGKKVNRYIFWAPRIFTIVFIAFLAMFSLDVFGNNYSLGELTLGLFMHNIPGLILIVILLISWKYEIVGAITFILLGIVYIAMITVGRTDIDQSSVFQILINSLVISGLAFLIGILFFLGWKQKKNLTVR